MALADDLAKLEKNLEIYRQRFKVDFYTIHDHLRDPMYPYTAGAAMIGAGSSNAPVIQLPKIPPPQQPAV